MNFLTPLGMLYGRAMDVRNRLYDRGLLHSHPLGARTISIGNLTAGGTGKTPLVALTAEILAESGERVCVLTRGYGRANERDRVLVSDLETVLTDASTGGDEPVELARKLLGRAVIVADADRVAAANWAKQQFDVTAFVLDDGFQHRRAKRDVDIVCVDASDPRGNGQILPAGSLRESFKGLQRADVIVLTRTNLVVSTDSLVERLKKRNPDAPIFAASTRTSRVVGLEDFLAGKQISAVETDAAFKAPLLAFCGLGNPENFRRQLEIENFSMVGFRSFGDHHRYVQHDIDRLEREAFELSAESLVTTAKDAVKLSGLRIGMPVFVVEATVAVDDPEGFRRLVLGRD